MGSLRLGPARGINIAPLMIKVEYFSRTRYDTTSALCASVASRSRTPPGSHPTCSASTPPSAPLLPTASTLRSACVTPAPLPRFPRSAALSLPQRHSALLLVAFAKAAEQTAPAWWWPDDGAADHAAAIDVPPRRDGRGARIALVLRTPEDLALLRLGSDFETGMSAKLHSEEREPT